MTYPPAPDPYQPQPDPYQAPQSPQYGAPYAQNPYSAPNAYGQPNPYGQPVQPGVPPQPEGTNGLAIASLVFGILGGVPFAAIFGIVALLQIRKRPQKGKGMAIAGLVLSLVWVLGCAGVVTYAVLTDTASKDGGPSSLLPSLSVSKDLQLGDCINGLLSLDMSKELRRTPPKVDCAEPHEGEVFRIVTLSGSIFPGDAEVQSQAETGCSGEALSAYAPDEKTQNLDIYYLYPTRNSWTTGDRDITCLVVSEKDKLTGSLKG